MPPPVLLNKYSSGRPNAFAVQSIWMFYNSVWDGDTAKLKPGVWYVVANIYAMIFVTAIADGKYPKYFGDCQNMTPGSIFSYVCLITC